ncbi:ankyrin repeat-containing domain protein [Ephemerocybe angulata]|uniref:protein S-acyltransferase n=1 Tax=Ephemerocybe angulata TaxID=980116 RepID=A0A8H6HB52_9AGAR|nr:ankyrin repeat-containing domain protein [Tulosesus angulatus]
MSTSSCKLPGNPDIAGVGVRIAIYIQNLLCFIPAFWALADGKVTRGELDAAETQATTNLVLAFAILISSIVQAQTLGLTNYHASIVLNMSWMNNTNAFIYFLLYVQYKSQGNNRRRVSPTWGAWARHIRGLAVSVIPGTNRGQPRHDGADPEAGKSDDGVASPVHDAQIDGDNDSRRGAKILVKRFVLLLGSLHLTLMAGLGLWLWSNIRAFGEGQDASNECAAKYALVTILGGHVPFASEALRIASFVIYAIFLAPGINLLLPIAIFLGLYYLWRFLPIPKVIGPGERSADSPFHYAWLRLSIRRVCNPIARRWSMFPPFMGLVFLLAVNLVFIIDIELALKQNDGLQDSEEAVWGFGQILAMLSLFMPLRDLAEAFLARRPKQRQKDLDMGLGGAINGGNWRMVLTWLARGANPNAILEGNITAIRMACNLKNVKVVRALLEAGADPNIIDGHKRDMHMVESHNKDCLRLLNQVEKGTIGGERAIVQASKKGYGAGVTLLLESVGFDPKEDQVYFDALSGIDINATDTNGSTALMLASKIASNRSTELDFEFIVEALVSAPGINANCTAKRGGGDGETALILACGAWLRDAGPGPIVKLLLTAPGIDVNVRDKKGRTALMHAAERGHEAAVKHLLSVPGIDVNVGDKEGRTAVSLAAEKGHEAVIGLLLSTPGIGANAPATGGRTPLGFAAEKGHETIVKLLLDGPWVDVNAPETGGQTPLGFAAEKGYEVIVKLLLGAPRINVNAATSLGWTPLGFAAEKGHEIIVKLLLDMPGIEINPPAPRGRTPLGVAAENGHETVVKLLLDMPGIDINAAGKYGGTPLCFAAGKGHEAILKLLLAAPEVELNASGVEGTPLACAAMYGHAAIVELLLAAPGIDVNRADEKPWVSPRSTPLMNASDYGHETVVKLLLAVPGIDVNAGNTPALCSAAENGHEAILKLLLAAPGINVNATDANGSTPLIKASCRGHKAAVKLLLAVPGIDVNAATTRGGTPLIYAAGDLNNREAIVKLLLAAPEIDVNAPDNCGRTPLSFAAEQGHIANVNSLLAAPGIDVNAADTNGRTPLIFAAWSGHQAAIKLLLAAPRTDVNAADTYGWTALIGAAFKGRQSIVKVLSAVPEVIVDVAHVKRCLKYPPEGEWWKYPASIEEQDKCVQILEELVQSNRGRSGGSGES